MPAFSFPRMIKLAFRNVHKILNRSRSLLDGSLTLTTPSPDSNSTTRIRCLSFTTPASQNDCLPLYVRAFEMETSRPFQKDPSNSTPSKTIISLAAMVIVQNIQGTSSTGPPVAVSAMVTAVAALLSGMFLKQTCPRLATAVDKFGILSFALGFFGMINVLLSGIFMWMGVLTWSLAIIAFLKSIPA